jgi:type III restriction enzyme
MNAHVTGIANRLSLRKPQKISLEILAHVCEIISLEKGSDPTAAIEAIRAKYETVTDFERDFPSLCFALATGVGKTRLMGAFIAYLYKAENIRHFFVLAPNLTIYNKLITDFTPNTRKYVFQGIGEFAVNPPEIITGDNYESGRGIRKGDLLPGVDWEREIHINIFNISKINSEVRGDKAPRIKRLSEYIGESYFEYLSKLDDLVILMDESHRYRASAGFKAINELKPILGLELTATPQIERAGGPLPFKNVIYSYPLSEAMADGFVKEPAVATRENFDSRNYDEAGLERLKLEDGIRIHENTKVELEVYARENGLDIVKPFVLVVARDTEHANTLTEFIQAETFFEGRYKGKAITVHSNLKGDEKDETVEQLVSVEAHDNPTEIVIHVNMLKEGWDVKNLYTIVPLRTANSRTLVEQSIGRGLRLPYGKRTGAPHVDRLTIVSHDKFQEIVDYANSPDSIIRGGLKIVGIPTERTRIVIIEPEIVNRIIGTPAAETPSGEAQRAIPFESEREKEAARATLEVIRKEYERLPRSVDLTKPEVRQQIVEKVREIVSPGQQELAEAAEPLDFESIVEKTIDLRNELSIDVPRIIVQPIGDVSRGYKEFKLTLTARPQPVDNEILIQELHRREQHRLMSGSGVVTENRPEDYLIRGLIDFDDICYDDHAPLLYKLCEQVVAHLRSYLSAEDDVLNVLQYHQQALVNLVHAQMQEHYEEKATAYEAHVSKGFVTLRPNNYTAPNDEEERDFRTPVDEKQEIRRMLFKGFRKCLYSVQKFDSDPERRFAVMLEHDTEVLKWFKPAKGDFQIHYAGDSSYEPDFVVETKSAKFLCEPKRASEMDDREVLAKARAAAEWCRHASDHEANHGGKSWKYLLVPHDVITDNKTLQGLAATYTFVPATSARPTLTLIMDRARIAREKFKTLLPVYSLKAACGTFGPAQEVVEPEGWIDASNLGRLNERMFVVHAVGRSMEPKISDRDLVAFESGVAGSRQDKIVLAQYRGPDDPETGGSYTIKTYSSDKEAVDGSWQHTKVTLSPLNPQFQPLIIDASDEGAISVIGIFKSVLK